MQGSNETTPVPTVTRLNHMDLRLGDGVLSFGQDNRAAIDAHWAKVISAKPGLWNGPFFLFDTLHLDGETLTGTARRTDFATFLYWRDNGRPEAVKHVTGTSLPVLSDGTLLAVRMAAHTANGGAVYFPAGSLEERDLVEGLFDVTASIARELAEETGMVFGEATAEPAFVGAHDRGAWHVARRNRLPEDFENCRSMLAAHQAETGDDEIDTLVAIRGDDGSIGALRPYARALAEWHFENPAF